ncbi:MAG: hypothetical protein IPM29_28460 [Planctomycetes bacterium]|nr:hypothetical protein [Planctomycetota bacterium]
MPEFADTFFLAAARVAGGRLGTNSRTTPTAVAAALDRCALLVLGDAHRGELPWRDPEHLTRCWQDDAELLLAWSWAQHDQAFGARFLDGEFQRTTAEGIAKRLCKECGATREAAEDSAQSAVPRIVLNAYRSAFQWQSERESEAYWHKQAQWLLTKGPDRRNRAHRFLSLDEIHERGFEQSDPRQHADKGDLRDQPAAFAAWLSRQNLRPDVVKVVRWHLLEGASYDEIRQRLAAEGTVVSNQLLYTWVSRTLAMLQNGPAAELGHFGAAGETAKARYHAVQNGRAAPEEPEKPEMLDIAPRPPAVVGADGRVRLRLQAPRQRPAESAWLAMACRLDTADGVGGAIPLLFPAIAWRPDDRVWQLEALLHRADGSHPTQGAEVRGIEVFELR